MPLPKKGSDSKKNLNTDYILFDVKGIISATVDGEFISKPIQDKVFLLHGEVKTLESCAYYQFNELYWMKFKNGETIHYTQIERKKF